MTPMSPFSSDGTIKEATPTMVISAIGEGILSALKEKYKEKHPNIQFNPLRQRVLNIPQLSGKYKLRATPIDFGNDDPNQRIRHWSYTLVEILSSETNEVLGAYKRSYPSLYGTFYPFQQNGKEYALYSKDYTATRVMALPSCEDVCGEEGSSFGFCPTEFYVPQPEDAVKEEGDEPNEALDGTFGFVAGCVWGDDSSWKIQYLDLSKIAEGGFAREERFGYIELPNDVTLKEAIDLSSYSSDEPSLEIQTKIHFWINRSVDIDFSSLTYKVYEAQADKEDPTRKMKCKHCSHQGVVHWKNSDGTLSCGMYVKEKDGRRCNCSTFEIDPNDKPKPANWCPACQRPNGGCHAGCPGPCTHEEG